MRAPAAGGLGGHGAARVHDDVQSLPSFPQAHAPPGRLPWQPKGPGLGPAGIEAKRSEGIRLCPAGSIVLSGRGDMVLGEAVEHSAGNRAPFKCLSNLKYAHYAIILGKSIK